MEYIERDKVATALSACETQMNRLGILVCQFIKETINSIPAADVRPVVRCCDCKHFQVNVSPSGYLPQGVPEWECRHWCGPTDPTDFCSCGEKREES